jgi:translation initiation factor IF-3
MRISRRSKKPEAPKIAYKFNEGIISPKVLVLNSDGSNLGVMTAGEAIRKTSSRKSITAKTSTPSKRLK